MPRTASLFAPRNDFDFPTDAARRSGVSVVRRLNMQAVFLPTFRYEMQYSFDYVRFSDLILRQRHGDAFPAMHNRITFLVIGVMGFVCHFVRQGCNSVHVLKELPSFDVVLGLPRKPSPDCRLGILQLVSVLLRLFQYDFLTNLFINSTLTTEPSGLQAGSTGVLSKRRVRIVHARRGCGQSRT